MEPSEKRTKAVSAGSIQADGVASDITDHQRAEEAFRESEQRYSVLFAQMVMGFALLEIIYDENSKPCDYRQLEVNPAFETLTGLPRDRILGKTILEVLPDIEPFWIETYGKVAATGESVHFENYAQPLHKWFEVTAFRTRAGHVGVTFADITERKRAERYQHLSAEILRTLNEPLGVSDVVNHILAAINRETGLDAVGIRLRSGDDFPDFVQSGFSPEFLRTENALIARDNNGDLCRDENGKISLECTCGLVISGQTDPANPLFTKGGSFWTNNSLLFLDLPARQDPRLHSRNKCIRQGYCSVALIPIRTNGDIVGLLQLNDRKQNCFTLEMIHFFEAISASIGVALMRKQQEEARRESEAGLAAAQRIAHIGSWEWNVQTDRAHWSDETFHIFGHAPGHLEEHRQNFLDMIHPQDKARVDQALAEAVNGTRKYDLDYRIQLPDGTEKVIHAQAETLRDEAGRPLLMRGTVQDITERQQIERDLQRSFDQLRALAARLQSIREEERKRVAREIHDQLGQALTAIKIDMSFLVRELPAGEKHYAKRTSSILQLVEELIHAVRRIATELRPGILDDLGLVAALEWAGEDFQARTGTTCRLDLPQDDIAVGPEQATAIFRIFQETLANVARHADASQVEVRLAKEDGQLALEVHDNGNGIPENKLSIGESLGILGMRERTMLLGGELTISGSPGNGTTVRVRIPAAPSELARISPQRKLF